MKPPFFIVGCGRSGTTLLQVLIDAHPAIAIPPESFLFERFTFFLTHEKELGLSGKDGLNRLIRSLLRDMRIRQWGLALNPGEFYDSLEEKTAAAVIDRLYSAYAQREGKTRWGDKSPRHMFYLPLIRKIFPEAKLIHLVRDGRDVFASLKKTWFGPSSAPETARLWQRYLDAFQTFKREIPETDILEITYENLVTAPERETKKIFTFLGEEPPANSGRLSDTDRKNFYLGKADHFGSLAGSVTKDKIGSYRRSLTPREIEIFEATAGAALLRYGYPQDCQAPKPANAWESAGAAVLDLRLYLSRRLARPAIFIEELKRKSQVFGRNAILRLILARQRFKQHRAPEFRFLGR